MRIFIYVLAATALLSAAACSSYTNLLAGEQKMLSRVAASNIKSEHKLDSLLLSGIRVMDAALRPVSPKKGGKIVARYYDQNQGAMEKIMAGLNSDFDKMNMLDQGLFIARLATRPSVKQFASLYPRFQRKYRQIQAVSKFTGFFTRSLGKTGKLATLLLGGGS